MIKLRYDKDRLEDETLISAFVKGGLLPSSSGSYQDGLAFQKMVKRIDCEGAVAAR